MEFFKSNKIHDFMGKSKAFITISAIMILSSYFLIFTKGLNYGIDFTGGTIVQLQYKQVAPIPNIREALKTDESFASSIVTKFMMIHL